MDDKKRLLSALKKKKNILNGLGDVLLYSLFIFYAALGLLSAFYPLCTYNCSLFCAQIDCSLIISPQNP